MFTRKNLDQTLRDLGAKPSEAIFTELYQAHTDKSRFYHNDQHISECLSHFQKLRRSADHPAEIEIAFWFHDAVYDTRANDNEERSADWAKAFLTISGVNQVSIERVVSMIIATKTHETDDTDSEILVDIDLGILGASEEAFERYDAAIRSEFHWVPLDQYVQGRAQVLQHFLDRDYIYKTAFFRTNHEQQARSNIARKINQLW